MVTERPTVTEPRRLALVMSRYDAASGTPPGIDPSSFARACLADSYELLADLVGVRAGIAGDGPEIDQLLWPGDLRFDGAASPRALASHVDGRFDQLVLVPADVPDLPGLVIAKVLQALQRADICVAPERGGGSGCAALGVRVPWAAWAEGDIDLNDNPSERLAALAPRRGALAVGPDWHRLRHPAAIQRLDPGLEGWEQTRALLAGSSLAGTGHTE